MKSLSSDRQLRKVKIQGYKSIADCNIGLGSINVLIGCNGAGKSNFISFFKMLRQMFELNLQTFVSKQGGPDSLLYFGRKKTPQIIAELYFGENGYKFILEPTHDNKLMYRKESLYWSGCGDKLLGSGHFESQMFRGTGTKLDNFVWPATDAWHVYHFHDTSDTALVKQPRNINDNAYFRPDASNLASFLYLLQHQHPKNFNIIVKTIQMAAPFFGEFHLRPSPENKDFIELEWVERGQDIPFKAHYLSDGTLRFICLATLLLQPKEMQPETILIDEPELGLHPYSIELVASMMKSVATKKQLILATQSVEFLNQFDPDDVLVVERKPGSPMLQRLEENQLSEWLKDYSLGELWKKNFLGGRPSK